MIKLPLFPLNTVLFPGMMLPLHIFEPRYREMIDHCVEQHTPFGVVLINSGAEVGGAAEPHPIGTHAHVARVERLPDGRMNIEVVGQERFRIVSLHRDKAYLQGMVENYPLVPAGEADTQRAVRALLPWLSRYLELLGQAAETSFDMQQLPSDPTALAYLAAIVLQAPMPDKQRLLAAPSLTDLLAGERALFRREISLIKVMLNSPQMNHDPNLSPN